MTAFIVSVLALLVLTILVFWLYPNYRADVFSHRINSLKDKLDRLVDEGVITKNTPVYITLENTMCGFIEQSRRINLLQVGFLYLMRKKNIDTKSVSFSKRLTDELDQLDESQKNAILPIFMKMHYQLARHLLLSSPLLVITLIGPLALYLFVKQRIDKLGSYKPIEQVEQDAYQAGHTC